MSQGATEPSAAERAANPARVQIINAAARAIAERGYHGVSMRELARATGRSLGAFYNHFSSKEELLFTLQRDAFDELVAGARRALGGLDGLDGIALPAHKLYVFVLRHVRYVASNPDVMRVLVQEAAALDGQRRTDVRRRKEAYFDVAKGVMEKLLAEDVDPRELTRTTYCLFGMLNWAYGWYEPERHGAPEELARTIHAIATRGAMVRCQTPTTDADYMALDRYLDGLDMPSLLRDASARPRESDGLKHALTHGKGHG